jgi:hypothetical protein
MNSEDPSNTILAVTDLSQDPSYYGYEERTPARSFQTNEADVRYENPMDFPSISPDRAARKQRSFGRRGGAGHSALLKSAVEASMSLFSDVECDDSTGDDEIPKSRQNSGSVESIREFLQDEPTSPRKRARRVRMSDEENEDEDDAIARASNMFGCMCVNLHVEEQEPVRRVSRRTSYDSRISDQSEFEIDEL